MGTTTHTNATGTAASNVTQQTTDSTIPKADSFYDFLLKVLDSDNLGALALLLVPVILFLLWRLFKNDNFNELLKNVMGSEKHKQVLENFESVKVSIDNIQKELNDRHNSYIKEMRVIKEDVNTISREVKHVETRVEAILKDDEDIIPIISSISKELEAHATSLDRMIADVKKSVVENKEEVDDQAQVLKTELRDIRGEVSSVKSSLSSLQGMLIGMNSYTQNR